MNESQQMTVLIALTLAIGIVGVLIVPVVLGIGGPGDVSIDSYNAVIYSNGTLREDFTYTFTNYNYQMMYRDWNVPVLMGTSSIAYVRLLSIAAPAGTTAYVKEDSGAVTILTGPNSSSIVNTIGNLAYND